MLEGIAEVTGEEVGWVKDEFEGVGEVKYGVLLLLPEDEAATGAEVECWLEVELAIAANATARMRREGRILFKMFHQ